MVFAIAAQADPTLDTIGVTLLRATDASLTGAGVKVAQVEAPENTAGTAWQVNPFVVGQPTNLFTYISSGGSASNYPNTFGIQSAHANSVAAHFYGTGVGVAPGVAHVDNFEANHFYQSTILGLVPIQAKIVNQTFIFGATPPQETVDTEYDAYAAQNNTLFISGVGNSGSPNAPSTAYNGIGVGALGGSSSIGPTSDNGRSKPDITAPGSVTSFSTPLVSGAAAILLQAALRGDAGAGTTNAAADPRTLKTLLLNGAIKPTNWTHTATAPLDPRFGSGVLNVFNSYEQLAAGKFPFIESTTPAARGAHLPASNSGNIASLVGWDFNTIAASLNGDKINHYYFNLPASTAQNFTLTATLVWNRAVGQLGINNLDAYLYNTSNNTLVASSISTVDNVEHIFLPSLPASRYDLQVLKKAGFGSETYALAFEIFAMPLTIEKSGTNVVLSWPLAPAGFGLQSTSDLTAPVSWTTVTNNSVITNNQNRVTISATNAAQFFRLVRP